MFNNETLKISEIWKEVERGNYVLQKSSEPTARGAICFAGDEDSLAIASYSILNSPMHSLIAPPGEELYRPGEKWAMNRVVDGIDLRANSERDIFGSKIMIETKYRVLIGYDGVDYKRRSIILDRETGEISEVSMNYEDGKRDVGRFRHFKNGNNNFMEIEWTCEFNPRNINISKAA